MALDNRRIASITSRKLAEAVLRVERLSFTERERLTDEVHTKQPHLFYSVLVLQRYGATLVQIEVVLIILLVFHEAMKISGGNWPVICEDVRERCLKWIAKTTLGGASVVIVLSLAGLIQPVDIPAEYKATCTS